MSSDTADWLSCVGGDMPGLLSASAFPDYDGPPDLAGALLAAGFSPEETGKILGGNYARIFSTTVA